MRQTTLPPDLKAVAYHEAGHAVMAWLQGSSVRERGIVIRPDGTGNCHIRRRVEPGRIEIELQAAGESLRDWAIWAMEADCSEDLAGPLAEKRYRGVRCVGRIWLPGGGGDGGDYERIRGTMRAVRPHASEASHSFWLDLLYEQTRRMLARPRRWAAVEALAAALLKRGELYAEEADRLLEASLGERGALDWPRSRAARLVQRREAGVGCAGSLRSAGTEDPDAADAR
jgi:hypothetical protein